MESERIIRFLREELTESEKLEVLDWIEKSDENKSIFSELKNTMILYYLITIRFFGYQNFLNQMI